MREEVSLQGRWLLTTSRPGDAGTKLPEIPPSMWLPQPSSQASARSRRAHGRQAVKARERKEGNEENMMMMSLVVK